MNRIDKKFNELKKCNKKAFLAFITAGDPNLVVTKNLVLSFEKIGVDIVELGVPFSDPMADGPTIQAASYRALQGGVTLKKVLKTVQQVRRKSEIPIALMSYYNPILHYGEKRFLTDAKRSGVDGLIIPDLPLEEAKNLIKEARRQDIATVFFLSPTTTPQRAKKIIQAATGFIYYVSVAGVTGGRKELPRDLLAKVKAAKHLTRKPVCVGFGISTPRQVRLIAQISDGVIVGSAIVKEVARNAGKKDIVNKATRFVQRLTFALKK